MGYLVAVIKWFVEGFKEAFSIYKPVQAPISTQPPTMPIQPQTTPTEAPPQTPSKPITKEPMKMLDIFCTAIRDFEGAPGSLNYQLNNPGDFRPSPVGYLAKYEPVEIIDTDTDPRYLYHKGKFAKFPTYELGWEYLQNTVLSWARLHPQWTILDFFTHYAPSSDKNPTVAYAENVAKKCGVPVSTTLKELFS